MSLITLLKDLSPDGVRRTILKMYYFQKLKTALRNNSFDDEVDLRIFRQLIKKGDSVVDIGANFGYYTLFLSKLVGDNGCVYSAEPIPSTFEILSSNIRKLGLNNVKAFNCAVSDKTGAGVMEIPKYRSGGDNYYQAKLVETRREEPLLRHYPVSIVTLDSLLFKQDRHISFLKIDVEGHELNVIKGATNTINVFAPALYIEVSGDPDDPTSSAARLFERLRHSGYLPYLCHGAKVRLRNLGDVSNDYFLLTERQYHATQNMN